MLILIQKTRLIIHHRPTYTSSQEIIQFEGLFMNLNYGYVRSTIKYASFKPFYFYNLSWVLVPFYEICQFIGGCTLIFQTVTSMSKSTVTATSVVSKIILGLLLVSSWLPLMIYNSLNNTMLNDIKLGKWLDVLHSGIITRSERVLNWFVSVKVLIMVIRKALLLIF